MITIKQRSRGYHFGPVYVYYNSDYKLFQVSWSRGSIHIPPVAHALVKHFSLDEEWFYYIIGALAKGRIVHKGAQSVVYVDAAPQSWFAWRTRLLGRLLCRDRFS